MRDTGHRAGAGVLLAGPSRATGGARGSRRRGSPLGRKAANNAPMTASSSASIAPTFADPGPLVTGESLQRIGHAGPLPGLPRPPQVSCETNIWPRHRRRASSWAIESDRWYRRTSCAAPRLSTTGWLSSSGASRQRPGAPRSSVWTISEPPGTRALAPPAQGRSVGSARDSSMRGRAAGIAWRPGAAARSPHARPIRAATA
jgi:hypothetical protein